MRICCLHKPLPQCWPLRTRGGAAGWHALKHRCPVLCCRVLSCTGCLPAAAVSCPAAALQAAAAGTSPSQTRTRASAATCTSTGELHGGSAQLRPTCLIILLAPAGLRLEGPDCVLPTCLFAPHKECWGIDCHALQPGCAAHRQLTPSRSSGTAVCISGHPPHAGSTARFASGR